MLGFVWALLELSAWHTVYIIKVGPTSTNGRHHTTLSGCRVVAHSYGWIVGLLRARTQHSRLARHPSVGHPLLQCTHIKRAPLHTGGSLSSGRSRNRPDMQWGGGATNSSTTGCGHKQCALQYQYVIAHACTRTNACINVCARAHLSTHF